MAWHGILDRVLAVANGKEREAAAAVAIVAVLCSSMRTARTAWRSVSSEVMPRGERTERFKHCSSSSSRASPWVPLKKEIRLSWVIDLDLSRP